MLWVSSCFFLFDLLGVLGLPCSSGNVERMRFSFDLSDAALVLILFLVTNSFFLNVL